MISSDEQRKISTWSRILAWVFVICGSFAVVSWILRLVYGGSWALGFGVTVLGVLGLLFIVPLFLSVAIWGRPPRWWSSIEELVDIDRALRRHIDKRNRR